LPAPEETGDALEVADSVSAEQSPEKTPDLGSELVAPTDLQAVEGPDEIVSSGDGDAAADSAQDAPTPEESWTPPPGPDIVEPPPPDCQNLPTGPFLLTKLSGPIASEDLAFDQDGNVVGSNDKAIFKTPYNGSPQLFVPDIEFRAAMRYLPNGHLIVCSDKTGELLRIDEQGTRHVVMSNLSYPNGLEVDLKGYVYFSEQSTSTVRRVNPFDGEATVIAKVSQCNGLAFSPDYTTLYIDGFSGEGVIYALSISPDGVPGKLIPWATSVGTGMLDGMGVDACGNLYVADYNQTVIYRISPDGKHQDIVIDGSVIDGTYLPNMQWGSGIGGWDPTHLYFPDGWKKGVFEVDIGVPSKPKAYP
jgi:hypothetical protein